MCTSLSLVYGLCKPCWLTHVTCKCFKETALLFKVHLSCFVDFILCPTDKYMFKVTNKKIRLICWMCSKLKMNTAWHSSSVFIVDFYRSQRISIVFLLLTLLTLNKCLAVFGSVWETSHNVLKTQKAIYLFLTIKSHSIQQFIITPNWNKL